MKRCLALFILAFPLPASAATGGASSSLALLGIGLACLVLLMARKG